MKSIKFSSDGKWGGGGEVGGERWHSLRPTSSSDGHLFSRLVILITQKQGTHCLWTSRKTYENHFQSWKNHEILSAQKNIPDKRLEAKSRAIVAKLQPPIYIKNWIKSETKLYNSTDKIFDKEYGLCCRCTASSNVGGVPTVLNTNITFSALGKFHSLQFIGGSLSAKNSSFSCSFR